MEIYAEKCDEKILHTASTGIIVTQLYLRACLKFWIRFFPWIGRNRGEIKKFSGKTVARVTIAPEKSKAFKLLRV